MNTKNGLGLKRVTGSHFFKRTLEKHPVTAFFVFVLALKVMHVALSLDNYVSGDLAIPWMMANDWTMTPQKHYFWGQDWLGTFETWFVYISGRWLFDSAEIIPYWFNSCWSQLLYSLGVTLMYKALVEDNPTFWRRPS